LSYLSDHLLWLQDDRNAVVADLNGQSAAVISGMALSGLHTVAAWDPDLHRIPGMVYQTQKNLEWYEEKG